MLSAIFGLKGEPQRKLSKPPLVVVATFGQAAQASFKPYDWCCSWAGGGDQDCICVHVVMVENVETFRPECQAETLGELESLAHGCVEVPGARSAEWVASCHSRWIRSEIGNAKSWIERRSACRRRQRHQQELVRADRLGI